MAFALKLPFFGRRAADDAEAPPPAAAAAEQKPPVSTGRKLQVLIVALILLLAVDGFIVFLDARQGTFGTLYIASVGKIRSRSQRLAKARHQASQGTEGALKQLKESGDEFAALMKLLAEGGNAAGTSLPPTSPASRPALDSLDK